MPWTRFLNLRERLLSSFFNYLLVRHKSAPALITEYVLQIKITANILGFALLKKYTVQVQSI